jgi:hypothetical protein
LRWHAIHGGLLVAAVVTHDAQVNRAATHVPPKTFPAGNTSRQEIVPGEKYFPTRNASRKAHNSFTSTVSPFSTMSVCAGISM